MNIQIFDSEEDYRRSKASVRKSSGVELVRTKAPIVLRDYQQEAYDAIIRDVTGGYRSVLCVLATGLGKTVLFSKIIEEWNGRVLVLVHLEELLQNAVSEIGKITGEIIGIERQSEHQEGERVVVSIVQSLINRLKRFPNDYFSLIIIDEAHHAASDAYGEIIRYFFSAKVVGLTATDGRSDGKALPFQACSFRMGIQQGIERGYLVPIQGRRVIIESIDLKRVKINTAGNFDDESLDNEMVKGAAAIADVVCSDYPFDKGILFFPGCASAKLTSDFINKRLEGLSVYVDGKIVGGERRGLIDKLRNGVSNWLCNVGIATEGFNWPECSVVGMCSPTLSRTAYVQRAGRGTRTLGGLLDGLSGAHMRHMAISQSHKPYMTILDFVGISANLDLISHESFLSPEVKVKEKSERESKPRDESSEEFIEGDSGSPRVSIFSGGLALHIESSTLHSTEDYDPFERTLGQVGGPDLRGTNSTEITEKQYNLLCKFGIDDKLITKGLAQKLIGFAAQRNFRLTNTDRELMKIIYRKGRTLHEASGI